MQIITRAEAKAKGLKRYFTGKPCKHGHIAERMTSGGNCLVCFNAWREAHPERIRAIQRKWDAANGARHRKRFYRENRDRILAQCRVWYAANKESARQARKHYASKNKTRIKQWRLQYYAETREDAIRRAAAWKKANPEMVREQGRRERAQQPHLPLQRQRRYRNKHREALREKNREYHAANPGRTAAIVAKRRALKLKATPPWLTKYQRQQMRSLYEEAALCAKLAGIDHQVDHIQPLQGKDRCGLHVPWNLQIMTAFENASKGTKAA